MANATIIDGKALATSIGLSLTTKTEVLKKQHGIIPGIGMILVGDDPASQVYVRNKTRRAKELGFSVRDILLPSQTTEDELLNQVEILNKDPLIHGFLVQLPLPENINSDLILDSIDPNKDADGFHILNAGSLILGKSGVVPATPLGCMHLIHKIHKQLEGMEAIVIGRSNTVGKPLSQLLLQENCTVTLAHSRTKDLAQITKRADIVVASVGFAELVRGDWIKPGATVIDVGINRRKTEAGKTVLLGDVAFDEVVKVAGAITPVPGGVGPMTIVCLLENTIMLTCRQAGINIHEI